MHLAQRQRHGLGRLVVRGHHDRVVTRVEQDVHRQVEGLLGAREAEDLGGVHPVVGLGDGLAQGRVAVGGGVAEGQVLERGPVVVVGQRQQVAERHGLGVGGGQVVTRGELPPGEVRLEAEVGQPGHRAWSFAFGALSSASRP